MLIKNGTVLFPGENKMENTDLLIEDGVITQIGRGLSDDGKQEIVDATGLMVAPGLVDVHVHFRDPGFTYKEDIYTGASAALKGGFTSVVLMANTKPCVDSAETLWYVLNKGRETNLHIYSCATVTKGMQGKELTNMEELRKQGAAGFTDDGIPIMDEALLTEAMERTAKLGVPISLHEEDPSKITNNGVHAGKAAKHFGIAGSPREAEISLIRRDLELALKTGAILNVQHISTKEGVELVRQAKRKGANIHAEATPHHFSLNEESCIKYGTMAKMNPPLREEADRLAVVEGLADGTIDLIATDHAPHSPEEKQKDITAAPSGILGLETALSLGIMHLVDEKKLTMCELLQKMSLNPARLYGIEGGEIKIGCKADLVIFDPEKSWKVEGFASKSQNSPFLGETMKGQVVYTIVDGRIIYRLCR